MKLDWEKIWQEHDAWWEKQQKRWTCKCCGEVRFKAPDWVDQQKHIQRTIERHLKKAR